MQKNNEHEVYLKSLRKEKVLIVFYRVLILLAFIILWEVAADLKWVDPFLTSSPSRMIKIFIVFVKEGTLLNNILITCYETILGFLLGTIIGAVVAVILWSFPRVSKVIEPYLVVLNSLPKVALAPIIIFWVGNGMTSIIVVALLISVVTTIINILVGFNEVDEGMMILMKTFQASKWQVLKSLVFPASIPILISALKVNIGLSWVGVIMGEFLVASKGLGFLIVYGGQTAELDMVMMSIVILAIIAFLMYEVVALIETNLINKK